MSHSLITFTFSYEGKFEWNLLQLVINNTYICLNILDVLCFSLLNKYENFKVCKFCQILHFVLKHYYNFRSYQNMLTILSFIFLYHNLKLWFICQVHYTPFTCGKVLLKIWDFETYFEILNSIIFLLWVFFECE
jgi:hypothetical protein